MEIKELRAENEYLEHQIKVQDAVSGGNAVLITNLRAELEAIRKQEPIGGIIPNPDGFGTRTVWTAQVKAGDKLFLAAGAAPVQQEPVAMLRMGPDQAFYTTKLAGEIDGHIWHKLYTAAGAAPAAKVPECQWLLDDDDSSTWQTACGALWQFTDGGPAENLMKYCHHCGGKVVLEAAPQKKELA
jgi:hypothetical protein